MQGVQLAGLFNVTKELNGVQLGIANITLEESNGLSLGLVNWIGRGRIMFETMATSPGFVDVSFRNGNRFYQYTYTAGVNVAHRAAHFGMGLGGHIEVPWGSLDLDVFGYAVSYVQGEVNEETGKKSLYSEIGAQGELRLSNSFQLGRAFSIVLAASVHAFSGGPHGSYAGLRLEQRREPRIDHAGLLTRRPTRPRSLSRPGRR